MFRTSFRVVLRARDLLAVARISVTHLHAHHDRFETRQSQQEAKKNKEANELYTNKYQK